MSSEEEEGGGAGGQRAGEMEWEVLSGESKCLRMSKERRTEFTRC